MGTEYEQIKRDTEASRRGQMPRIHNEINLRRKPSEEDLSRIPFIQTDTNGIRNEHETDRPFSVRRHRLRIPNRLAEKSVQPIFVLLRNRLPKADDFGGYKRNLTQQLGYFTHDYFNEIRRHGSAASTQNSPAAGDHGKPHPSTKKNRCLRRWKRTCKPQSPRKMHRRGAWRA